MKGCRRDRRAHWLASMWGKNRRFQRRAGHPKRGPGQTGYRTVIGERAPSQKNGKWKTVRKAEGKGKRRQDEKGKEEKEGSEGPSVDPTRDFGIRTSLEAWEGNPEGGKLAMPLTCGQRVPRLLQIGVTRNAF